MGCVADLHGSQGGGRRLLQAPAQDVAVSVTVQAPSANASDVAALLNSTVQDGSLQDAIARAGVHMQGKVGCDCCVTTSPSMA